MERLNFSFKKIKPVRLFLLPWYSIMNIMWNLYRYEFRPLSFAFMSEGGKNAMKYNSNTMLYCHFITVTCGI